MFELCQHSSHFIMQMKIVVLVGCLGPLGKFLVVREEILNFLVYLVPFTHD